MKLNGYIISINLGILLIGNLLIFTSSSGADAGLGLLIGNCLAVSVHTVVLFFAGILTHGKTRMSLLISSLLVLTIGFGTCFLSAKIAQTRYEKEHAIMDYPKYDYDSTYFEIDTLKTDSNSYTF